jgi:hypothetical protein
MGRERFGKTMFWKKWSIIMSEEIFDQKILPKGSPTNEFFSSWFIFLLMMNNFSNLFFGVKNVDRTLKKWPKFYPTQYRIFTVNNGWGFFLIYLLIYFFLGEGRGLSFFLSFFCKKYWPKISPTLWIISFFYLTRLDRTYTTYCTCATVKVPYEI